MEEYTYIDNAEDLIVFRKYLYEKNITKIAVDFEGEYNLHIYGEKLCLIQIFDGNRYFIIDPLKIDDVEIVKTINNKSIIKYMYGAESDIGLVYKQYGTKMNNVFDQKNLVDVLNLPNKGLDGVVNALFGIENKSKAKYQKYNWLKRPIEKDAMIYALNDVKYLFEISRLLMEKIVSENKLDDLIVRIIKNNFNFEKARLPGIFKKKEFKDLNENNKKIFTKIYEIRENYAKILNMPPHNLLENVLLFDIINKKIEVNSIKFNKNISQEICSKILEEIKKTI